MPVVDSVLDTLPNGILPHSHWTARDEVNGVGVVDRSCMAAKSTIERPEPLPDVTEHLWAPSLTTKPVIDQPQQPVQIAAAVPQARSLDNFTLSVMEIDELFTM